MKIDLHVHSKYSTRPSHWVLQKLGCHECYTEPQALYRIAKERGISQVTITDQELREVMRTISYDPGDEEWYSTYHEFQESAIPVEVFSWSLKLIGWLQYAHPQGPGFPEASCG